MRLKADGIWQPKYHEVNEWVVPHRRLFGVASASRSPFSRTDAGRFGRLSVDWQTAGLPCMQVQDLQESSDAHVQSERTVSQMLKASQSFSLCMGGRCSALLCLGAMRSRLVGSQRQVGNHAPPGEPRLGNSERATPAQTRGSGGILLVRLVNWCPIAHSLVRP